MRKYRLSIFFIACIGLQSGLAMGGKSDTLELTEAEFLENRNFVDEENIARKSVNPLGPKIVVEEPELDDEVYIPVEVIVRFEASDGATIDVKSLKVKYGFFDITERVLETFDVDEQGMIGTIETGREGKYKIRLSIQDNKKRKGEAQIVFVVTGVKDLTQKI